MGRKRKAKSTSRLSHHPYKGTRGLEVLKLLCFYGFNRISDIIACACTCKDLRVWSRGNVVVECSLKTVVKFDHDLPKIIFSGWWMPTEALLKCQKEVVFSVVTFSDIVWRLSVVYADVTAVVGNMFHVHVFYDRDTPGQWHSTIFSNPSVYMTARLAWEAEDDAGTRVTGINTYVSFTTTK